MLHEINKASLYVPLVVCHTGERNQWAELAKTTKSRNAARQCCLPRLKMTKVEGNGHLHRTQSVTHCKLSCWCASCNDYSNPLDRSRKKPRLYSASDQCVELRTKSGVRTTRDILHCTVHSHRRHTYRIACLIGTHFLAIPILPVQSAAVYKAITQSECNTWFAF